MKIAVLIVGEYRTFPYCRKSMTFLDNPNYDIYFSTWSVTAKENSMQMWHRNHKPVTKAGVTETMIRETLKVPAVVKIQDIDLRDMSLPIMIDGWCKGFELITQSGKKYDYVFLIRPDMFFNSQIDFNNDLVVENNWIGFNSLPNLNSNTPGLDDCTFFASFDNMKRILSDNLKDKVRMRSEEWHSFWFKYITQDCGLTIGVTPFSKREFSASIARFGIDHSSTWEDVLELWIDWLQSQRAIHVILKGSVSDLKQNRHTMRFLDQDNLNTHVYVDITEDVAQDEIDRIIGRPCNKLSNGIKNISHTDLVLTVPTSVKFTFDSSIDTKKLTRFFDNTSGYEIIDGNEVTLSLVNTERNHILPMPFNGHNIMLLKNLLFIFDLDGVLLDSKDMHYQTLNAALSKVDDKYAIDYQDHLIHYDGRPTIKKLERLTEVHGLPVETYQFIRNDKQSSTIEYLKKVPKDEKLIALFKYLKSYGNQIAVASNSVKQTVETALTSLGLIDLVDLYVSNEDVTLPKPHPEMFWQCMTKFNRIPSNTIIIEDSPIGQEAARLSGAILISVLSPSQLTRQFIENSYNNLMGLRANKRHINLKMNVLIPMAGLGKRFSDAGYTLPKPLIDVNGRPMIESVVSSLSIDANYIFLVQKEHYEKYDLNTELNRIKPGCKIVIVDGITEGAACTTLLAKELVDNENPLMIVNSDQLISWDSYESMYTFTAQNLDGGILTFFAEDTKWSYVELDSSGFVTRVAEKEQISNIATVGVYYWKHGSDYVKYAEQMIAKNIRVNNEFYVCPVFNEAINDGKKIKTVPVDRMYGLGTPEDLTLYLNNLKLGII